MSAKDKSSKKGNPRKAEVPRAGNAGGKSESYRTLYVNESTGQTNYPRWREEVIKEAKATLLFHTAKSLEEDKEVLYPRPKLSDYMTVPEKTTSRPSARSQSSDESDQDSSTSIVSRKKGAKSLQCRRRSLLQAPQA